MDESATITHWIAGLKQGDERAAEAIWQHYFDRLVQLARQKLGSLPRATVDEEDVALSAFKSLMLRAREGRFPRLDDRDDLWKLLVVITARKAIAQRRRFYAVSRPDSKLVEDSRLCETDNGLGSLDEVMGREPSPEVAALFAEEFSRRFHELPNDEFRQIALWRLEGYTNREIAEKLGTYEVRVERKLRIIRRSWSAKDNNVGV